MFAFTYTHEPYLEGVQLATAVAPRQALDPHLDVGDDQPQVTVRAETGAATDGVDALDDPE